MTFGLAAVALARNDSVQAKVHVKAILAYLAHNTMTTDNAEEAAAVRTGERLAAAEAC